jgi:hypothetical protein
MDDEDQDYPENNNVGSQQAKPDCPAVHRLTAQAKLQAAIKPR